MMATFGETRRLERAPHYADAAVHHVGGPEDVGAGLGLHERLPLERLERRVVDQTTPSSTSPS
jgi:hypothetical protein